MAHLPALPGAPLHDAATGMAGVVDAVAATSRSCSTRASTRVMFCNENDRPYRLQATLDAAAMARVVAQLAPGDRPFGVDYLWDAGCALAVAVATGAASSARSCPASTRATWACGGPIPAALLRERRALGADGIAVLMNVTPEFASPWAPAPPACAPARRWSRRSPTRSSSPGRWRARAGRRRPCARSCDAVAGSAPVLLNTGAKASNIAAFRRRGRRHRRLRPQGRRRHLEPGRRERVGASWPPRGPDAAVLLGLDVGTTALKAVLLDPERGCWRRASRPLDEPSPAPLVGGRPGRVARRGPRHRAGGVRGGRPGRRPRRGRRRRRLRAVRRAARRGRRAPAARRSSTTTAAPTARSTRCASGGAERVLARTGAGVTQQSVGPKLRWLARHEPESAARRAAWRARTTGSPGGSRARFNERNWALESGLYDLERPTSPTTCWRPRAGTASAWRRSATPPTSSAA